jgi:hypothetical protein
VKLVSGLFLYEIVQFQDFFKVQTLAGHDIVYQQASSSYLLFSLQSIDEQHCIFSIKLKIY